MRGDVGALFQGVFEAAPDAVVIVDEAGQIVTANPRCQVVFGCAPEDLVGKPVDGLVPERFRDGHLGRRAGYGGHPDPRPMGLLRLAALRADGTEFPAEISLAPIEVDGARYVSATVRDISSRIREEERFRLLLEAAPDPTVIVDESATIVLVNNRVQEVLGHARDDLVGEPLAVLVSSPAPHEVEERLARYLESPESVPMGYSPEFRVWHRRGHDLPVEISLSPLQTVDGLLVSIALRDVTERVRLEEESQRLRDELIATVSHELRTPLTSIIGYAELMADLDESDLGPRARRLLSVIDRNAARELRLVDDLLTMAFLDDNRLQLKLEPVDLTAVCRRVVDDQALRARERGVSLECAAGPAPSVVADFHRLVQVVENLVTNALKFTPVGGRVDIDVVARPDTVAIEVRDTGIGVPPEHVDRLFDRLYRAPEAISNQVQGAGLGLSIARRIVEAHDGHIDLESEVDVGTVVRVTLPRGRDAAPAAG